MCGIFAFLCFDGQFVSKDVKTTLHESFMLGKRRGPEQSKPIEFASLGRSGAYVYLGFHRLAINGLSPAGMQPFTSACGNYVLVCNGEIYNYKQMYKHLGDYTLDEHKPGSDCQVIIDLYRHYGIEQTLHLLDGVFSFVLLDKKENRLIVARDRIGIRSLYRGSSTLIKPSQPYNSGQPNTPVKTHVFSSELSGITSTFKHGGFVKLGHDDLSISQFTPGTYTSICLDTREQTTQFYWNKSFTDGYNVIGTEIAARPSEHLLRTLEYAVRKRVETSERPICCLLSGGIDSSFIAALVCKIVREQAPLAPQVETFSIGVEGSDDLKYAAIVAKYIGSKHTEVIVTADEMFAAIPEVIGAIETFDTTTVRASVGNYLVCKYISNNSNAKVVFNGDGADEVMGGYIYFNSLYQTGSLAGCKHQQDRTRLLGQISHYDVLRSDKCIASNGLEARTPYLDIGFVRKYFALHDAVYCSGTPKIEKELFRNAIMESNLLPVEVTQRRKEAFSDGVSGQTKSWKDEIEERLTSMGIDTTPGVAMELEADGNLTIEQAYYKSLFRQIVMFDCSLNDLEPTYKRQIETRWMPSFVSGATDPSARTLNLYKQ